MLRCGSEPAALGPMVLNAGQNILRSLSRPRRVLALAPPGRCGGGRGRAAHSLIGRGRPLQLRMVLAQLVHEAESKSVRRHVLRCSICVGERSGGPQPVCAQRVDRRRQIEVRTPLLQVQTAFCLRGVAAEHVPNARRVLVRRGRSRLRAHEGNSRTIVDAERESRLSARHAEQKNRWQQRERQEMKIEKERARDGCRRIEQDVVGSRLAGWERQMSVAGCVHLAV